MTASFKMAYFVYEKERIGKLEKKWKLWNGMLTKVYELYILLE